MKVIKQITLGVGKEIVVKEGGSPLCVVIRGHGGYASLTKAEASALFGALRELDNEGLLEET